MFMYYRPLPSASGVDAETQCLLLPSTDNSVLELQFRESIQINSRLSEELGAAKREIELLKGKLKELEVIGADYVFIYFSL